MIAVDEGAPQAVVDHHERRHGHFAGLGLRRERVLGDAADLGVFALELAAVLEQQRLAVGGSTQHANDNASAARMIPRYAMGVRHELISIVKCLV